MRDKIKQVKQSIFNFRLALFAGCILFSPSTVFLQNQPQDFLKQYNISFPVLELGNCQSYSSCRSYCDDPLHQDACLAFAKKQGIEPLLPEEKASGKVLQEAKQSLGCGEAGECRRVCSLEENFRKCHQFALKQNLPGGYVVEKQETKIISEAKKILGCNSLESCRTFCQQEVNASLCGEFAKKTGIKGGEEKKGPGGCTSKETCQAYCTFPENYNDCSNYAVKASTLTTNVQEMKFKGPGGCTSESSCKEYCLANPLACNIYPSPSVSHIQSPSFESDSRDEFMDYCQSYPQNCTYESYCRQYPAKCQSLSPAPISPTAVSATSAPASDGSFCNDSDGKDNFTTRGTCTDQYGTRYDNCDGSIARDYYCKGTWNGTSWNNYHCEANTFLCTNSNMGCFEGRCFSSSSSGSSATSYPTPTSYTQSQSYPTYPPTYPTPTTTYPTSPPAYPTPTPFSPTSPPPTDPPPTSAPPSPNPESECYARGCRWENNSCYCDSGGGGNMESDCNNTSGCYWTGTSCHCSQVQSASTVLSFPIPELGNCTSCQSCSEYCTFSENRRLCESYAQTMGIFDIEKKEEENIYNLAQEQLGCDSEKSCQTYCQKTENYEKCRQFAASSNIVDQPAVVSPKSGETLSGEVKIVLKGQKESVIELYLQPIQSVVDSFFIKRIEMSTDLTEFFWETASIPNGEYKFTGIQITHEAKTALGTISITINNILKETGEPALAINDIVLPSEFQPEEMPIDETILIEKVTFQEKETKKGTLLTGRSLPNSLITLIIYSNPIVVTVKTDENGYWTYTLEKPLSSGSHTAYVAVVRSDGSRMRSSAYSFIVPPAFAAEEGQSRLTIESSSEIGAMMIFIYLTIIIIIFSLIAVFVIYKLRSRHLLPQK